MYIYEPYFGNTYQVKALKTLLEYRCDDNKLQVCINEGSKSSKLRQSNKQIINKIEKTKSENKSSKKKEVIHRAYYDENFQYFEYNQVNHKMSPQCELGIYCDEIIHILKNKKWIKASKDVAKAFIIFTYVQNKNYLHFKIGDIDYIMSSEEGITFFFENKKINDEKKKIIVSMDPYFMININNHILNEIRELKKQHNSEGLCVICLNLKATHTSSYCGHYCVCAQCGEKLKKCPLCRVESKVQKVYCS